MTSARPDKSRQCSGARRGLQLSLLVVGLLMSPNPVPALGALDRMAGFFDACRAHLPSVETVQAVMRDDGWLAVNHAKTGAARAIAQSSLANRMSRLTERGDLDMAEARASDPGFFARTYDTWVVHFSRKVVFGITQPERLDDLESFTVFFDTTTEPSTFAWVELLPEREGALCSFAAPLSPGGEDVAASLQAIRLKSQNHEYYDHYAATTAEGKISYLVRVYDYQWFEEYFGQSLDWPLHGSLPVNFDD